MERSPWEVLLYRVIYSVTYHTLSWIFAFLHFLVTPLLWLVYGLLSIALFPLQLLMKFEAFLYFVTGAVLTGITVGLFLHFSGGALSELLRLQSNRSPLAVEPPTPKKEALNWEPKWDHHSFLSSTIPEEEENSSA
ncbi:hypothetical protein N7456_004342 [Penicillium angulare]|uniref:Uncharacterized protein n=1 Tax=Penicillium angulare TaxID=116970 RepID=A0A9W9FWD8_9EURO|nr:hypothetical protein N7456_004342 [Penicillium angulare]